MPATRKSGATPVRATRSQGYISQKSENPKSKRPASDTTEQTLNVQEKASTASVDIKLETASLEKQEKPGASRVSQMGTPVKQEDIFSPRRSSRASMPNSRFKDMEMLGSGRKRPADREKEKEVSSRKKNKSEPAKKKGKVEDTSKSDTQIIMEEVVTEETQIDTLAQMSMFDELIVPSANITSTPVTSDPLSASDAAHSVVQTVNASSVNTSAAALATVPADILSTSSVLALSVPDSGVSTVSESGLPVTGISVVGIPVASLSTVSEIPCSSDVALSATSSTSVSLPDASFVTVPIVDKETMDSIVATNTGMLATDNADETTEGVAKSENEFVPVIVEVASETIVREDAINDFNANSKVIPEIITETVTFDNASIDSSGLSLSAGDIVDENDSNNSTSRQSEEVGPAIVTIDSSVTPQFVSSATTSQGAEFNPLKFLESKAGAVPQVIVIPPASQKMLNLGKFKANIPIETSVSTMQGRRQVTAKTSEPSKQKVIYVGPRSKIQKVLMSPKSVLKGQLEAAKADVDMRTAVRAESEKADNLFTTTSTSIGGHDTSKDQPESSTSVSSVSSMDSSISSSTSSQKNTIVALKPKSKPKSDQPVQNLRYEVIRIPTPTVSPAKSEVLSTDDVIHQEMVTSVVGSTMSLDLECDEQLDCYGNTTNDAESSIVESIKILTEEDSVDMPAQSRDTTEQIDRTQPSESDAVSVKEYMDTIGIASNSAGGGRSDLLPGEKVHIPGEKIKSSFCQVIEYERHKELLMNKTQTAIEYVMFGNKMVPIHKPYSASHGRQQGTRPSLGGRSHGRVELPGQAQKPTATVVTECQVIQMNKDVPTAALDLGTSIDQSMTTAQVATIVEADPQVSEPAPKILHGYIETQPTRITEPTQVIEISQDLFAKEVYGDSFIVDPVTGEMVPVPSMEMNNRESFNNDEQGTSKELTELEIDNTTVNPVSVTEVVSLDATAVTTSYSGPTDVISLRSTTESDHNALVTMAPSSDCKLQVIDVTSPTSVTTETSSDIIRKIEEPTEQEAIKQDSINHKTSTESETADIVSCSDSHVIVSVDAKFGSGKSVMTETKLVKPVQKVSTGTIAKSTETRSVNNVIELVDVKIVPGKSKPLTQVKSIKPGIVVSRPAAGQGGVKVTAGKQTFTVTTKSDTTSSSRSEIQTQTESVDDEDEDDDDEEDEEGFEVPASAQTIVVTNENHAKLISEGRPSSHEYVVVHLPEGTEIKQHHTRTVVRDPMRDEVVTMTPEGLYVCVDCNHKTDKKSNWYKHRRKHLGIRPHACTKCSYKAATSSNLKRHMQIHDDIRNFSCNICGLMFRQKIHLERHIKYKHQEKNIKCPLCDYLCANENPDLKIHIRRRHVPQDGSMSAFSCPQCGLMTVSKKDLKQHMKFHKKGPELKLFCEYCSFVTDCESRLRRHVLVHTKERPFQCGLCSYRATQKEHVLRHMRSQHDIEVQRKKKQGVVEMKDKKRRSLLEGLHFTPKDISGEDSSDAGEKAFERSDYSCTEKIFACNHCSMKFAKLINLYKHLYAQHKQVMPDPQSSDFQCVVCEFKTNNKKNLLVHMRKHNTQDHNPPSHVYSCVLCRYINPRRRNLFQHMRKKHGIEIMMKEDGMNCYVTSDNSTLILSQNDGETSEMALSDIVHTQALDDDSELHIVTDNEGEFQAEKISIDNIIAVEDINSYVPTDTAGEVSPQNETVVVNTLQSSSVPTHEAAEAIEGLQALAQQSGPLDITEMVPSDILNEGHIVGMEQLVTEGEQGSGIQLSSDQLNQLSSGDYVEINGEVYKVEIAHESAGK